MEIAKCHCIGSRVDLFAMNPRPPAHFINQRKTFAKRFRSLFSARFFHHDFFLNVLSSSFSSTRAIWQEVQCIDFK